MVKKIISGQTYDTDTAMCVHQFVYHGGDCHQGFHERLCQTLDGAFFFWEYDGRDGWEGIKSLTDEEAFKWLELHADHLLEQYFGSPRAARRSAG
jgi:hypothetical protein